MTAPYLQSRQNTLVEKFSFLPDPQERLSEILAYRPKLRPLAPEQRTDALLVRGCTARVWVAGVLEDHQCHFAIGSESILVSHLAGLLCELYDGASPEEIVSFEPQLFEQLEIARNLSPTRLNGLASVRQVIRDFAAAQLD